MLKEDSMAWGEGRSQGRNTGLWAGDMPATKGQFQEQLLTFQPKLGRVRGFILTITALGPQCHLGYP